MPNRKLVISMVLIASLALIAYPVLAHCGKCAGSAKEMVTAMDTGKVTLTSAVSAAETAAKGKALMANTHMHDKKLQFEVYVLAGEKIMKVDVDGAGKAGTPAEAKELPTAAAEKKPAPKGG